MSYSSFSKKGFTLIEVLIVVTLLGVLGVVALASYINSTDTFTYFSNYKSISSSLRSARSLAITNSVLDNVQPDRFFVELRDLGATYEIELLADTGTTPFLKDAGDETDVLGKTFSLDATDYTLVATDSTAKPLIFPVTLFYEKGSGEFNIFQNGDELVSKTFDKYITIEFSQNADAGITRYVQVFQVSGLPEECKQTPCVD